MEVLKGLLRNARARDVQTFASEMKTRSATVALSIEPLSLVAESNEIDAGGTDREANRLLDLAKQIGELTSRFVC